MKTSTEEKIIPASAVRPTGDHIVIEPPSAATEAKPKGLRMVGKIAIPDSVGKLGDLSKWEEAEGRHFITKAIAAGPECKLVKTGDMILVAIPSVFYVNTGALRMCGCTEKAVVGVVG